MKGSNQMKAHYVLTSKDIKKRGDYAFVEGCTLIMSCPNCGKEMGITFKAPPMPDDVAKFMWHMIHKLTLTMAITCQACGMTTKVNNGNLTTFTPIGELITDVPR